MRSMKIQRHRLLVSLIVLLITATMIPVAPASAATPEEIGTVPLGDGLWWDGEHVQNATMFWETCDPASTCWHYYLDVPEGGKQLRVGMDFRDRESHFAVRVRKTDGTPLPVQWDPVTDALDHTAVYTGPTNLETYIDSPAAGRYLVTVVAIHVVDDTFRMRAILDAPPSDGQTMSAERSKPRPLLPNAIAVPPFNLTFDGPVDGGGQYEPPTYGTAGVEELEDSCTKDERLLDEPTPVICLRFAAGGFNVGEGTLSIRFDANATKGDATQFIDYSGKDQEPRPAEEPHDAGEFELHEQHRHFHYSGAITYSLHEVLDLQQGIVRDVGTGHKTSYCMVDYTIADWASKDQDRRLQGSRSNCGSADNKMWEAQEGGDPGVLLGPNEGRIGWSRGWGDMYPWWRQGQYVEFSGAGGDGLYLLRSQVDPYNNLLETHDNDNVAYTLFRLTGYPSEPTFEYVERGRGQGPWDPDKKVLGPDEEVWTY